MPSSSGLFEVCKYQNAHANAAFHWIILRWSWDIRSSVDHHAVTKPISIGPFRCKYIIYNIQVEEQSI